MDCKNAHQNYNNNNNNCQDEYLAIYLKVDKNFTVIHSALI